MKTASILALCTFGSLLCGCSSDDSPATDTSSGSSGPGPTSTVTSAGSTSTSGTSTDASSDTSSGTTSTSTTAATTTSGQTETGTSEGTTDTTSGTGSESSTGSGFFPDGLECTSISLCSTYDADPSRPPFPAVAGGTLEDGLYRAVQGSSEPYGLAIAGDRYALIFEGLTTAFGELEVDGVVMTQIQTAACSSNGVVEIAPQSFDFAFWTDGDELFTYSGCDSLNPDVCGSGTRLVRVDSLCDDLQSLGCEGNDCECHTFTDRIPAMPDGCGF